MRSDFGAAYRELYDRHWWWRARERVILDIIVRKLALRGPQQILDVGCGDGLFFDQLLKFGDVQGIEPAAQLVDHSGKHRSRIYIGAFDASFKPREGFTLILMLDVIEHMADPVAALRLAWNLLAPGGTLLITVPAFMLLWTGHDVLNHHFVRYTKTSVRRLAEAAGLKFDSEMYLFHWLFPVKVAARIVEGAMRSQPELPRVPPDWLNGLLLRISWVEYRALHRLRIPFGSSLMALAQKRDL